MSISEFKSKCIAVLKSSQRSGKGVIVTWRGRPIARVEPIRDTEEKRILGTFRGRMKVRGNIVQFDSSADWEMLR
jgi:prevent-host-death family protein